MIIKHVVSIDPIKRKTSTHDDYMLLIVVEHEKGERSGVFVPSLSVITFIDDTTVDVKM